MKIAFISQSLDNVLPPQQSSIGIWSYQVAQRLAKTHQVSIYLKHARDLPSLPAESKIKYRLIKAMPNQLLLNLAQRYARISNPQKPLYAHVAYNLEYSLQIARDLAKQNYDIVHIQNFSQFVPIIRQFNPNTKIILHMHCEWLSQLDRHMIEKRLLQTDLIIGCSHYIVNKIKAQFPQFADKCCTIFNGVDVEQFTPILEQTSSPGNDYPRLLFVGRLSPEKGIHILLEAFSKVLQKYPQARLLLLGSAATIPRGFIFELSDKPMVQSLSSFYEQDYFTYLQTLIPAEYKSLVSFTGARPHQSIPKYYHQADILVNPSLSEAFGMSLIEAMAIERPVVAARTGGMVDIVDIEKTGLLVEAGNSDALANSILRLLSDAALRHRMGQAGRQRVLEHFSWEKITNTLQVQYERLLEAND